MHSRTAVVCSAGKVGRVHCIRKIDDVVTVFVANHIDVASLDFEFCIVPAAAVVYGLLVKLGEL